MIPVRCPTCHAGALIHEWVDDYLPAVAHMPWCKHVAPVRPTKVEAAS